MTDTSHDETKTVPFFVQTDVNCLWYNPWGAVWCFESRNTHTETQRERKKENWGINPAQLKCISITWSLHHDIRALIFNVEQLNNNNYLNALQLHCTTKQNKNTPVLNYAWYLSVNSGFPWISILKNYTYYRKIKYPKMKIMFWREMLKVQTSISVVFWGKSIQLATAYQNTTLYSSIWLKNEKLSSQQII